MVLRDNGTLGTSWYLMVLDGTLWYFMIMVFDGTLCLGRWWVVGSAWTGRETSDACKGQLRPQVLYTRSL